MMIRGRIRDGVEPIVSLTLHGRRASREIEAILDTGFTGHLCLAKRHRAHLQLTPVGEVETEMADGRRVSLRAHTADVTFMRQRRTIIVTLTSAADSLVGTALLREMRLVVDFPRGLVEVRRVVRAH
jgi:clan AA aspartic protease